MLLAALSTDVALTDLRFLKFINLLHTSLHIHVCEETEHFKLFILNIVCLVFLRDGEDCSLDIN